jgi:hypothetical protein
MTSNIVPTDTNIMATGIIFSGAVCSLRRIMGSFPLKTGNRLAGHHGIVAIWLEPFAGARASERREADDDGEAEEEA